MKKTLYAMVIVTAVMAIAALGGHITPDALVLGPAIAAVGATNFVQDGKVLELAAPYARSSGEGAKVGSIFGVAIAAVSSGAAGNFQTEGVFELTKDTTDITAGLKVYWDDSAKKVTATSTSNLPIGVAIAAAGTGVTLVKVKLGAPPNAGA